MECGERVEEQWQLCPFCGATILRGEEAGPVAIVCDDSATIRHLVRSALRKEFPRIYEAENGREALDLVFQVHPAILIVDQEMPVMTGVELIRDLRSRLETATLPIIMLTGTDVEGLESEVLDLGADDYLQKPITPERLCIRAKAVISSHERALGAKFAGA